MRSHFYEYRKFVLAGIALVIVLCYIVRLAFLQLSDGEHVVSSSTAMASCLFSTSLPTTSWSSCVK